MRQTKESIEKYYKKVFCKDARTLDELENVVSEYQSKITFRHDMPCMCVGAARAQSNERRKLKGEMTSNYPTFCLNIYENSIVQSINAYLHDIKIEDLKYIPNYVKPELEKLHTRSKKDKTYHLEIATLYYLDKFRDIEEPGFFRDKSEAYDWCGPAFEVENLETLFEKFRIKIRTRLEYPYELPEDTIQKLLSICRTDYNKIIKLQAKTIILKCKNGYEILKNETIDMVDKWDQCHNPPIKESDENNRCAYGHLIKFSRYDCYRNLSQRYCDR